MCGPQTDVRTTKTGNKAILDNRVKGRKTVYIGRHKWTHKQQPYQRNLEFNGKEEKGLLLTPLTSAKTARCSLERERYLAEDGCENAKEDLVHRYGMKCWSYLDDLPYWQVSLMTCSTYSLLKKQSLPY